MVKIKGIPLGISASLLFPTLLALFLLTTSCEYDHYDAQTTIDGMNPDDLTHVNFCEEKTGGSLYGMYMYLTGWREGNMSFFPTQGTRQPNGAAYKIGNCGNYHNATADTGGRVNIMHIHHSNDAFKVFENTQPAYYLKSVASPVRCVRTATVVQQ